MERHGQMEVVDFKLTSQGAYFPKEKRTPREGEKQFRGKIMYKGTESSQKWKEEQFLKTVNFTYNKKYKLNPYKLKQTFPAMVTVLLRGRGGNDYKGVG
jgi:hypothetical protein